MGFWASYSESSSNLQDVLLHFALVRKSVNVTLLKGYAIFYFIGELCYRLWLIYDKKELKKNNLEFDIYSEEVKIAIELQVTYLK